MATSRKPTEEDRIFGRKLAARRRACKVTQRRLAEHLGLSMQQIGKYERGESRLPTGRREHVEKFLAAVERGEARSGFGFAAPDAPRYRARTVSRFDDLRRALEDARNAIARIEALALPTG